MRDEAAHQKWRIRVPGVACRSKVFPEHFSRALVRSWVVWNISPLPPGAGKYPVFMNMNPNH